MHGKLSSEGYRNNDTHNPKCITLIGVNGRCVMRSPIAEPIEVTTLSKLQSYLDSQATLD